MEEFRIPEELVEKLKDPELLRRYVVEGKTFQEILGFSSEVMEKFYQGAYALFSAHCYSEAADAFLFLTTVNPYVPSYWIGLGMCEQLNEEYRSALVAYSMAILGDRQDPLPHYHAAACYHALDDLDNAVNSLNSALEAAGDREECAKIKEESERTLGILKQKRQR